VKSYEKAMYLGFPRAAAMAETGWSPKSRKNYADFTERLAKVNEHYKAAGLKVGPLK
jgi:hexosaminidase